MKKSATPANTKSTTKAPAKAADKAVATRHSTEVSTSVIDFAADAGKGVEHVDKSSMAIPFLIMLQGQSPQLRTVEGAKPGLLMNSITSELYEAVNVIPCAFQRKFIRWTPRSAGGGFKGELDPKLVETGQVPGLSLHEGHMLMDVPQGCAQVFDKDGRPLFDHLSDTRNHFVLVETSDGEWQPALLALSSTQIKKSKNWVSQIKLLKVDNGKGGKVNPASFSHVYRVTAVEEKNNKGSWFGFRIELVGPVHEAPLYQLAKDFHASVSAGHVETTPPPPTADEASAGGDGRF